VYEHFMAKDVIHASEAEAATRTDFGRFALRHKVPSPIF
jgi:hypothetical protein